MNDHIIFCPGGARSQTGAAVSIRYPDASIEDCGNISDVLTHLDSNLGPYVVPIWNSHQGEVEKAQYVWNHIEEAKIKITDIWAKRIEFWFVRRTGDATTHGKIGSVVVAKTQCSVFLGKRGAELVGRELTTIAFAEYREGAAWDGVLVAERQGENEANYEVVSKQTANANNFTSFIRLVPSRAFAANGASANSWLTGVMMRSFSSSLEDSQQSFFEQMLANITDLNDIPKLIFVFKRTAKVGLLFEGTRLYASDLLDVEELESGEISIYEEAGATAEPYTKELDSLFTETFPTLNHDDFIVQDGVSTCLFACPPLGLYTHGYEIDTVEPVIRFYISRLFQLWNDGAKSTPAQDDFFEHHKDSWQEKGSKFITFKKVSPISG